MKLLFCIILFLPGYVFSADNPGTILGPKTLGQQTYPISGSTKSSTNPATLNVKGEKPISINSAPQNQEAFDYGPYEDKDHDGNYEYNYLQGEEK
jgi:hypothetical protein